MGNCHIYMLVQARVQRVKQIFATAYTLLEVEDKLPFEEQQHFNTIFSCIVYKLIK